MTLIIAFIVITFCLIFRTWPELGTRVIVFAGHSVSNKVSANMGIYAILLF